MKRNVLEKQNTWNSAMISRLLFAPVSWFWSIPARGRRSIREAPGGNVWNAELKMKSSKKSDDMVVQRYGIVRTTTRREQRRGSYGTADSSNSRSLQSLTEKAATWTRNSNLNHLNNSAEHTHSHTQSTRGIGPSPKADVSVNQRVKQGSWHHTKRAPARKTFDFG